MNHTITSSGLAGAVQILQFPLICVDSDNDSEFVNHHLLDWRETCSYRNVRKT
ncbi:hypothetical protein QMK17_03965 [Rhodococcus sp. G-MC3]|uniref:hypothetical protein n=1 Tax=Rhodococcus sp. G-MC3 TaxID=3046209 RepID=UPI0024B8FB1A|nr:hypothetical protein [Rhodococcus sp. G-MC3]MDJ0392489.1 hypothetical protein [Rhodococcus sp. G-MC3]